MKLLVAVDGTSATSAALSYVQALDGLVSSLRLLHVVTGPLTPQQRFEAEALVARAAGSAGLTNVRQSLEVRVGVPADVIVESATDVDLIVLGTGSRSPLGRLTHWSVAEEVARRSSVPTLVVREGLAPLSPERVVVAVDMSPPGLDALALAAFLAQRMSLPLFVVHVVTPPSGVAAPLPDVEGIPGTVIPALVENASRELEAFLRGAPVTSDIEMTVIPGSPAHAITRATQSRDLLVCGTHGRSFLGRLALGSVAQKLIRTAPCPVVVVRPRAAEAAAAA